MKAMEGFISTDRGNFNVLPWNLPPSSMEAKLLPLTSMEIETEDNILPPTSMEASVEIHRLSWKFPCNQMDFLGSFHQFPWK